MILYYYRKNKFYSFHLGKKSVLLVERRFNNFEKMSVIGK